MKRPPFVLVSGQANHPTIHEDTYVLEFSDCQFRGDPISADLIRLTGLEEGPVDFVFEKTDRNGEEIAGWNFIRPNPTAGKPTKLLLIND